MTPPVPARPARRTRILATIGPATRSEDSIRELLAAGVDAFRLNFSHGTREEHAAVVATIRAVAGDRQVAIVQDLAGPKLRLATPVRGEPGDVVEIRLPASVRPGDPVLLADGAMHLEVVGPGRARVLVGGDIPAGKGINLPSSRLDDVSSFTDKDRSDLAFGARLGVDWTALSFVRRAEDLRPVLDSGVPAIAKIEKAQALEERDSILAAADAIMVARGDLGVEIPIERVPIAQKELIAAANRAAKPVITATQMLRSMVDSPLPTRAEATDVANAVLDGTDVVMLSEETAIGRFAVEAVRVMGRIVVEAERALLPRSWDSGGDLSLMMAAAACAIAERAGASAIVVPTRSGTTARRIAAHRPRTPILALVPDDAVRRRLALSFGVTALASNALPTPESLRGEARDLLVGGGHLPAGATVVLAAASPAGSAGPTNLLHVATL